MVVILTDGEENASTKYSPEEIKGLITKLDATQLWTFTFIGANQDSVTTANSYGIHTSNVANYSSSRKGTKTAFAAVTAGMSNMSSGYMSFASGGASNRSFMSSVLQDSVNIGEDDSQLNIGVVPTTTTTGAATGAANGTATTASTDVDDENSKA